MKALLACLLALALCGCVSATAIKTLSDGSVQTIKVKGFLAKIDGGSYTTTDRDGVVTTLTIQSASPDQQSIAVLAGAVTEMGKSAMLMSKPPTNTVSVSTNASGYLLISPK